MVFPPEEYKVTQGPVSPVVFWELKPGSTNTDGYCASLLHHQLMLMLRLLQCLLLLVTLSGLSCRQDGFLGCNNIMAFRLQGKVFNATQFNNRLFREVDPFTGVGVKYLTCEAVNEEGEYVYLEITDFRDGVVGNCLTVEPYYANIFINYCVPGVPFACNQYRLEFRDDQGQVFVQTGDLGQLVVTNCDANDARINWNFSFDVEDFSTGAAGTLDAGSFSLCYLVL